jgi:long-chain acyl-CoA synthetase
MTAPAAYPPTIPELFDAAVAARQDEPALGVILGGQLTWRTWGELAALVAIWEGALAALGVKPGDRVAQISTNCLEWILADFAIHRLGAVHVPLHAALAAPQAAELIAHCGAAVVLVRDAALADRIAPLVPPGTQLVLHSTLQASGGQASGGRKPPGSSHVETEADHLPKKDESAEAGGSRPPLASEDCADALATILYTSGTTGPPLGVMLSQRNLVSNAVAMTVAAVPSSDEIRLCLLPLSHIYARTCDLYTWLVHQGRMVLAESRETIFRDCQLAAPNAINAVPYFYQKVVDRLRNAGGAQDAAALRNALGGALRRCYCGGASLPPEVDRFFAERGLPIHCGYGLTESAPVIAATIPGAYRSGTVGPPLEGVEVRLADDGEVLARGPNIMLGYWQNEAATARAIQDGWLHTGDLGEWDAAGHLRIVGRKKEMIVLATGKKVAPTRVEQLLAGSPWIEQACVVGDARKCLAALIVPNGDALRGEIKRRRLWIWSRRRALTHPQVVALYREEINRCLSTLADFEQVGPFTLLGRAFALEHGEVTPKLSLCRTVIQQRFADEIDLMYRQTKMKS